MPLHSREAIMHLKWIRCTTAAVGLLWTYVLLVLFYGDTILGVNVPFRYLAPTIVASFGGLYWLVQRVYWQQLVSETHLKALTVVSITILLSLITVDISYSVYFNAVYPDRDKVLSQKSIDQYIWGGELNPRRYYPTEKAFVIHKPNVTTESDMYGGFYSRGLRDSPTVANSVLELRHILHVIDEHGFRETTPLEQAHLFALGDSFTFGMGVSQDKTWVKLLEQAIGEPTYNLGVSSQTPQAQLMLLEYLLTTKPAMEIRHLLWMIFEGNDLEDSREVFPVERPRQASFGDLFKGTIVEMLRSIPLTVQNQSVIHRLRTGEIALALPFHRTSWSDPHLVDNIRLVYPLYHSPQYGFCLFEPNHIKRAGQPDSYVLNHPNRRLLDQTFTNMASLSQKYRFEVTVLIAPSAPRLYGPYFEGFPPLAKEPHFINYIEKLSKDLGFDAINLYQLMQPHAREVLLFWRDDSHWNENGHKVVAEVVMKHLKPSRSLLKSDRSL
jgi:hypothetical protein